MMKLLFILMGLASLNTYANNCGGEFQASTGTCRIIGPDGKMIIYNSTSPQSGSGRSIPKKIIRYTEVEVPPKYGALALNKKTGIGGGAINMNSKAEAKKEAIKRCENGGSNAPCKVIVWVKNGCFATATNSKNTLFAVAEERGRAEQVAMNRCKAAGASGCRIADHEACSIPDLSKY